MAKKPIAPTAEESAPAADVPPTEATASAPADGIAEEEITAKVRAGLTRAQAIEVIANQRSHDAAQAKG